jgi:tetratricopeptide (TPR) repeat protein
MNEPLSGVEQATRDWSPARAGHRPAPLDPALAAALAQAADAAGRVALLRADQCRRWQQDDRPAVESYLEGLPGLAADSDAVLDLIYNEVVLREAAGETPTLAEYERRFPRLAEALRRQFALHEALSGSLLAALPGQSAAPSGPPPDSSAAHTLTALLVRWEEARQQGQSLSAEELCRDCPQHLPEVERRLRILDSMCDLLDLTGTPPPGNARGPAPRQAGARTPLFSETLEQTPEQARAAARASLGAKAGPTLPGYEIVKELGRGGMGVVYQARQLSLNRTVALKMVLAGGHASESDLLRFLGEAEAVAALAHPHVVQLFDFGRHQGLPFFTLEFMPGGSLADKLRERPLAPPEAARLVAQLADGMRYAHGKGIVHRDLKPANVLLADAGTPKITDFGLAKRVEVGSGLTASGAIMGTPSYMAPEQAGGKTKQVGPAADVYALGAILYECLTGRPPFKAATPVDTILQVINEEPVPPSRLQPKVPRDLETICLKCLQKEPHRRYPSAEALAGDLDRFLRGEPIQARRVGFLERAVKWARRRPTAAALAGVLVAVAVVLAVAGWQFAAQLGQRRAAEQKRLAEARAEVHDLFARGQAAAAGQDWKQAEALLDRVAQKAEAEPALADLRPDVESVRGQVKARLAALDTYQRFVRDRDEALFHATLAGGENFQVNRQTARERAGTALAAVGFSADGQGALNLAPSFTPEEKTEITTGSYALLLMLAEIESRRLPQQTFDEHRRQLRQALALLDRADGLGVRTRAIHLCRARYLTLLGDAAGAATESMKVQILAAETDLDPQDHFLVGHEFYSRGDLAAANQEFRRALQLNARHFWTHYFLGICCVTAGKPEVAVAHLTICQGQQPKLVWIYLLRGFALGQMEDYAGAEADFDRAVALRPSPATLYVLYNNRGVMRVGRKETWAKGVEDLKQAAALRPDQYQARASLAEAYRLANRLDEAARYLDEALAVAGRQVQSGDVKPAALALLHHSRARLSLQRQDREAAVRDLAEAARLAADDAPLRARAEADRGRVLHLQQRFDEALAAYDVARKADPGRLDVLRWQGEVLLEQRRYAEAAAAFDGYLEKGGTASAAVYRQRGLARAKFGRHEEAIEDYGRALEAKPKDEEKAPLHLYRGQEYLALGALQPALRDFEEAVRLEPDNADAYLGRAHVRVKLGDARGAVADAERAVKGEPKEPRLWYAAARLCVQAGEQKAEPGKEAVQARLRTEYQARAVALLETALALVPAGERQGHWRDNVLKDAALYPLRRLPEFDRLAARYGGGKR